MLSLKELQEKTSPVHKKSAFHHGKSFSVMVRVVCLLHFLGHQVLICGCPCVLLPRSEELSLHPL